MNHEDREEREAREEELCKDLCFAVKTRETQ